MYFDREHDHLAVSTRWSRLDLSILIFVALQIELSPNTSENIVNKLFGAARDMNPDPRDRNAEMRVELASQIRAVREFLPGWTYWMDRRLRRALDDGIYTTFIFKARRFLDIWIRNIGFYPDAVTKEFIQRGLELHLRNGVSLDDTWSIAQILYRACPERMGVLLLGLKPYKFQKTLVYISSIGETS